jgi:hypothetical protein
MAIWKTDRSGDGQLRRGETGFDVIDREIGRCVRRKDADPLGFIELD